MPPHLEQYERMLRWYGRFRNLTEGRNHTIASENYVDEIYSFFLNAYHMKDWIKNDPSLQQSVRENAETYVNSNRDLRVAADVANALKHLDRNSDRSGENPNFGAKEYGLALGGTPRISISYKINVVSGSLDAYTLATGCVEAWRKFLTQHNLLQP